MRPFDILRVEPRHYWQNNDKLAILGWGGVGWRWRRTVADVAQVADVNCLRRASLPALFLFCRLLSRSTGAITPVFVSLRFRF